MLPLPIRGRDVQRAGQGQGQGLRMRMRGRLVQILPDWAADGLPLHLVWQRNRQLLPKVDALLTFLGDALTIR